MGGNPRPRCLLLGVSVLQIVNLLGSQECEDFGVLSYAGTNTGLEIKHETRSMESQRPDCEGKKGGFTFCLRSV